MQTATSITSVESAYQRRERTLFQYLRLNQLTAGRDVIALAVSRGRSRAVDLISEIRSLQRAEDRRALRTFLESTDREALLHLATLLGDQPDTPTDSADAALILRAVGDALGPRALGKEARFRLVELTLEAGEVEGLDHLLSRMHIRRDDPAQPHLFTANACNPFHGAAGGSSEPAAWLQSMDDLFAVDGLESLSIAPGDEAPFDRIFSGSSHVVDGPLVTVIIPTYDPGPRLGTAVESLLAQSYRALQILIMDDASPVGSAQNLDLWKGRDPRIEVVHLAENNGPYLARNIAASRYASGDYVTIHDDDDWSHPRKIELQVAHLEAEREFAANMTKSVRASDELHFGRINANPVWTQQGLNSLMVRRSVFDEIGYWDVLNRSADAEFNDRIRSWTQNHIPTIGRVPMTFYRVRWDSLSAGEFNRGYMDPRRRWYFHAYLDWHNSARASGQAPRLSVDDRGARPFAAPIDLLGSRSTGPERRVKADLVFAGDFRLTDADANPVCVDVEEALAAGLRVALLQLDSPVVAPEARINPRILAAARCEHATVVALMDHVEADLVTVFDPTVLQFIRPLRSAISTRRLVLEDRVRHPAEGALHDPERVVSNAEAVFGCSPHTTGDGFHQNAQEDG